MKARVPIQKKLPRKTLLEVEGYAKEVVDRYEQDCMRRFFKIACLTLNKEFGFGKSKLTRFIIDAGEKSSEKDEIFWWHLDQLLIDKMGIPFEREKEG